MFYIVQDYVPIYKANSVTSKQCTYINRRLLSGNIGARFCNGVRTVRCQISHIRRHYLRKLLGGRLVLMRTAGLSCTELGASSADHQSFRSAEHTALLVLCKCTSLRHYVVGLLTLYVLMITNQMNRVYFFITLRGSEGKILAL